MRLIDAVRLLGAVSKKAPFIYHIVLQIVESIPTIEAEPVRHGRWEYVNDYQSQCTNCKELSWVDHDNEPNYCPNCGAKMDGADT